MPDRKPRPCNQCGAIPGTRHGSGCDIERCAICGGQLILCNCVYELSFINVMTMEQKHPEIYENGATDEMWEKYEAAVEKLGGPLLWSGEYPDCDACREFNLWGRWVDGQGFVSCEKEHPEATENLGRLHDVARWDREKRKWVRKEWMN